MNDLDKLATALARDGYYIHLYRRRTNWECWLFGGDLPANQPRPQGTGATAVEAVEVAMRERERKRAA